MTIITPELLLRAYRSGIFPMAEHRDDPELFWVDPRQRGIIPLNGLHISRSLARRLRRDDYSVTVDQDFEGVIDACADRQETWINQEIRSLFIELHERGIAHSLEVWMDGELAGGVYGLEVGGAFCGESMFSRRRDGSKIALCWLIDLLRRAGFSLFDTQFLTEHLASLGGIEINRADYRARLLEALSHEADFAGTPLAASGQAVVQRNAQTS
ncbi:MAG: leucyl/phenylalanyl-tRNA--protein transferase [Rhodobacteraceae bacterium]|jgi:leucyl/phenylalanyl-tRNA--protein transferase|uniref:Leucyl/phenylalanyl-tRNA--protein transferase n=1 Tax=Salipiger profundus TaxID=1229727 RepID=A0A1U7D154_9RHOB|nr:MULTISPECIES: leucyl/phenylalanyl-tRNA--protein transferase [Salipiger]APX21810.1 leucyl/phenylalanyl-tRNA--protein transferase [Salipiger profundus]MAB07993.1 leucyl/phenylalanyl-tRNA--protein transferase [Paracoccaceae bacterium]GGA05452.1 leucyl/phenylalanyl-tRNA--protein transferase [Salipiger profundus]SFC33028.1 leucyl/phenylalanyl-tRNA--protein transferase [Salipiger profundus]|tara:strand:- start:51 stop:689 length:639 start_codon:yes stop_codon:yes gene_type:complete